MTPIPYLFFNGTCRAALEFYAQVFGGEIEMMMTYADMPPGEMEIPESAKGWIMHGAVKFGDGMLMASDDASNEISPMAGISIHMALPSVDAGKAAFDKLAEEGEVGMPYQATFWTPGFGTVKDKFGTRWMVSTTEPLPQA